MKGCLQGKNPSTAGSLSWLNRRLPECKPVFGGAMRFRRIEEKSYRLLGRFRTGVD